MDLLLRKNFQTWLPLLEKQHCESLPLTRTSYKQQPDEIFALGYMDAARGT